VPSYDFAENEYELDPQASSARGGGPPRKQTGIGVLDSPFPAKKPRDPLSSRRWLGGFTGLFLFAVLPASIGRSDFSRARGILPGASSLTKQDAASPGHRKLGSATIRP
jgi:hypothetical protein